METNVFFSAVQSALDAHIERMVEGRVVALAQRIIALEERIATLESNLQDALLTRIAALEERPATAVAGVITPEMIVESMNKAEWLWEKVNAYIETGIEDRIERAIDDHCETYDHDSYDSLYGDWSDYSPSAFVSEDDLDSKLEEQIDDRLEEKVNETLRNASFEIRVL